MIYSKKNSWLFAVRFSSTIFSITTGLSAPNTERLRTDTIEIIKIFLYDLTYPNNLIKSVKLYTLDLLVIVKNIFWVFNPSQKQAVSWDRWSSINSVRFTNNIF